MSVENVSVPCPSERCFVTIIQDELGKSDDSPLVTCGGDSIWYVLSFMTDYLWTLFTKPLIHKSV